MKSKTKPLVSIIVNCFNGEKYLKESLDSILNQTYKNWEIIFWDNRSTDQSSKIFKSYKDQRFKYFYAFEHTLLYKARNEAIKKADGELLAFLDVDDWWEKDKAHEKIDKSIQDITFKQIKKIKEWEEKNPDYLTNKRLCEEWQMMVMRMMGGKEKDECKKNMDQIKRSLCSTTELKGIVDPLTK